MAEGFPTPDSLNRTGVDLYLRGDYDGALLHYHAALIAQPNFYPAMANMVSVVGDKNHLEAARVIAKRLLGLFPQDGKQRINLGGLLMRLERYPQAEKELNKAKETCPDDPNLWYNLALLYHRLGRSSESLAALDRVEALGHSTHNTRNDRAHMLLAQGRNLTEALVLYEARWNTMIHLPPWDYHIPEWQGEDLRGKTIMLHGEQGFGDTIMTVRFGRWFDKLGAKVVYCVPQVLVKLLEAQSWVEKVVAIESLSAQEVEGIDYHSPLYSAMRWLKVDWCHIDPSPYLVAPKTTVPLIKPGFNIGICWASGKRADEHMNWRRRVSPLTPWLSLAENPKVNLWCLQQADVQEIEELGAEVLIDNPMHQINDWAQTAAFVDQLDLVVAVDTAIVHLAGAMGKPVYMISQFSNCWRWKYIDNNSGEPWYSSMRIFRQHRPGDWETPIREAKATVQSWA